MMNHRRQSVHNRDVCIQLYHRICRPFIISGQSLQKHSRTNISPPPPPLLLQFYLSLRFSPPIPRSHPLSLLSSSLSKPPPSSASTLLLLYSSHCPSTLLVQPTPPSPPPTVCFRVENTIIYSFVFPSLPVQSIFTGKYQVASREEVLGYMVSDFEIKIYFLLFLCSCFYCAFSFFCLCGCPDVYRFLWLPADNQIRLNLPVQTVIVFFLLFAEKTQWPPLHVTLLVISKNVRNITAHVPLWDKSLRTVWSSLLSLWGQLGC